MTPTLVSNKSKTLASTDIPKGMVVVREGLNTHGATLATSTSKDTLPTTMMVGDKACYRIGLAYLVVDTMDFLKYDGTADGDVAARIWGA